MSQINDQILPTPCDQTTQMNENEKKADDLEGIVKSNLEKIAELENELKQKDADLAQLRQQIVELETQVNDAQKLKAQHTKEAEEIQALKVRSEDILTRAKSMIFDKTKIIKNQELQIEALNQQVSSMKDVLSINKELLEIRNLEVKQLETKMECMENKIAAEKDRHELMHKKLETMIRYNADLKREYETQLCLFSALRERYSERELAKDVVSDLERPGGSGTNSTPENQTNGEPDTPKDKSD